MAARRGEEQITILIIYEQQTFTAIPKKKICLSPNVPNRTEVMLTIEEAIANLREATELYLEEFVL